MSCGRSMPNDPAVERLSELIRRVGRGDQRAFSDLHAATRNKMRKTALAVSPSISDLDDLLQDSYLKIWRHAAHFDPRRSSPITWMCFITRNTVIDALRLKRVTTTELEEAMSVPEPVDTCDEFDYAFARPIAANAIEKLPDHRRRLLSLAYLDGESRSVLARHFGVPVGTIKTWLRRTLEDLRKECLACQTSMSPTRTH